mgnify:CR=1 FL=1
MSDEKNLSDDLNDMLGDAKDGAKKAADKASGKASELADEVKELAGDAKEKAKAQYDSIVADAQVAINQQKNAALTDVKNQVGALVIEVAEKVLHKELSNKAAQETYINELAEGVKLN